MGKTCGKRWETALARSGVAAAPAEGRGAPPLAAGAPALEWICRTPGGGGGVPPELGERRLVRQQFRGTDPLWFPFEYRCKYNSAPIYEGNFDVKYTQNTLIFHSYTGAELFLRWYSKGNIYESMRNQYTTTYHMFLIS